jgi:hypothetical protein
MRFAKSWFISAVLVGVFAGCGSVTSSAITFHEEGLRGDNDAIIYVFREKSMVGYAVEWNVYLDNSVAGVMRQNAYMALHVTPGPHTIKIGDTMPGVVGAAAESAADNPNAFIAKPGQAYFIRSKGFSVDFLTREQAWPTLEQMKEDR